MKRSFLKRAAALAAAVLLILLVLAAFVLAILGAPREQLIAIFFAILLLSVLLYAVRLTIRLWKKPRE